MRTTIPDSSNLKNSQEFAKYNYYVTKAVRGRIAFMVGMC